jgi:hypothetical protein
MSPRSKKIFEMTGMDVTVTDTANTVLKATRLPGTALIWAAVS